MLTFIVAVPLLIGCGPARPPGMPDTAPCRIIVLQDGNPVPDVVVMLYREGGNGALSISGTTDAFGVAVISTSWGNYTTRGAPVGINRITVDKFFEMPPCPVTPEESALWTPAQGERYERERQALVDGLRIIPVAIANINTTPLSVSIEPRIGGSLTIEISDFKN